MERSSELFHQFLSEVFGDILKREEASLATGDLSLREVQLIDAVCRTVDQGGDNRSTAIAAARQMPAGTLTCAVGLLEKKGYLVRRRDEKDRRAVRLLPTQGRQRTAPGLPPPDRRQSFIRPHRSGGLRPAAGAGEAHRLFSGRPPGPSQSETITVRISEVIYE